MNLRVQLVDVFGTRPFSGNPLAVVDGSDSLSTDEMQRIARWFNLSETAFLLPPTTAAADYGVRIFTLDREMPFAGHPTLGACHVWLAHGNEPRRESTIVQECGAGLVRLRRTPDGNLSFAAPALARSGPPTSAELDEVREFLGVSREEIVDAAWIDNGPGWLGVRLSSAQRVLSVEPQRAWPRRIDVGIVGPHPAGYHAAFEVRAFFSDHLGNIVEDPVTGSLNAAIGQWLFAEGIVSTSYLATQGTRLGREGRIRVEIDEDGHTWLGGKTRTHVSGGLRTD